jgi:hypothetical protein
MILPRMSSMLCLVLVLATWAGSAEITKTDDSVVTGNLVSFDGKLLVVKVSAEATPDEDISIPLSQIARVKIQDQRTPAQPARQTPPEAFRFSNVRPVPVQAPPPDVLSDEWQMDLVGGDHVRGWLRSGGQDHFNLQLKQSLIRQGQILLQPPVPLVRELWRASPELVRKARQLNAASKTEDIAYVFKDGEVLAVKGTVLGIQDQSLGFLYDGRERKINVDHLLGIEMAAQKHAPATPADNGTSDRAIITMQQGDRLSGRWTGLKEDSLSLETPWRQTIALQVALIANIEIRSGQIVYLSELKPSRVQQTPYFNRVIPWRADTSLEGGPLKLQDGWQYAHGIAVHSRCVLEYDLEQPFEQFRAVLGFEPLPANAPPGRVAVRVLMDGKTLFENADVRSDQPAKNLSLDLHGGKRLTLEVDFGQDQDVNDRVVWADARLIKSAIAK